MDRIWREIQDISASYKNDLQLLFGKYVDLYDWLLEQKSNANLDDEELYIVNRFCAWYLEYGCDIAVSTIRSLDDTMSEQICGFADLYMFLLDSVKYDIRKLVDQMYYVIGRFAKDFIKNAQTYVGRCFTGDESLKQNMYVIRGCWLIQILN